MGEKVVDFVYLAATMPGTCIGVDTSSQSQGKCRAIAFFLLRQVIGLMSTTGTRTSRVWHDLLEPLGYKVVEVPEEQQADVHDAIYNKSWGTRSLPFRPLFVQWGNKSTLCT